MKEQRLPQLPFTEKECVAGIESIKRALGPKSLTDLFQHPWSNARRNGVRTNEISTAVGLYRDVFGAVAVRPDGGISEKAEEIARSVDEDPGPFIAYCKGDQKIAAECSGPG
jgi:hypothetical protein